MNWITIAMMYWCLAGIGCFIQEICRDQAFELDTGGMVLLVFVLSMLLGGVFTPLRALSKLIRAIS